jgi:hypothetical protein
MPKRKSKKKKTSKKTKKSRKKNKTTRKKPTVVNVSLVNEKRIPAVVKKAGYNRRKLNILLGYLIFFVVAFVLTGILYSASVTDFNKNLFFMLSLIFGAFSITLLIVLLIYVFMRVMSK